MPRKKMLHLGTLGACFGLALAYYFSKVDQIPKTLRLTSSQDELLVSAVLSRLPQSVEWSRTSELHLSNLAGISKSSRFFEVYFVTHGTPGSSAVALPTRQVLAIDFKDSKVCTVFDRHHPNVYWSFLSAVGFTVTESQGAKRAYAGWCEAAAIKMEAQLTVEGNVSSGWAFPGGPP